MGDHTGIEWTDATWNPIRGCSRVSEGCRHCYAERVAARFSGPGLPYEGLAVMRDGEPRWTGKTQMIWKHLEDPLRWRRPRRIFVNSMSDLFHEDLAPDWIGRIFAIMAAAPQHTFQILTKRPRRMHGFVAGPSSDPKAANIGWPLPNVWLGVSAENQATADERIPLLLETPAAVRFVSAEPLLGAIDLDVHGPELDWLIVGGESGPGARPMQPEWARSLRDQCVDAGVAFFFKQWGEHDELGLRVGKKRAGRLLDGREWNEFPHAH